MDMRAALLHLVIQSGEFERQLCQQRQQSPGERFVVVICDLDDKNGRAAATWDKLFRKPRRKTNVNVWVYSYPLSAWQEQRRKLVGKSDSFDGDEGRFAVVSGASPLLGAFFILRANDNQKYELMKLN